MWGETSRVTPARVAAASRIFQALCRDSRPPRELTKIAPVGVWAVISPGRPRVSQASSASTAYEPSGSDFLSPSLCEAALMQQSLPGAEFATWLSGFMPSVGADGDALLRRPAVLDETDGKAVHLHGLALSRSWLLRTTRCRPSR